MGSADPYTAIWISDITLNRDTDADPASARPVVRRTLTQDRVPCVTTVARFSKVHYSYVPVGCDPIPVPLYRSQYISLPCVHPNIRHRT